MADSTSETEHRQDGPEPSYSTKNSSQTTLVTSQDSEAKEVLTGKYEKYEVFVLANFLYWCFILP